jgi:trk system potassium uptake protein TrkA
VHVVIMGCGRVGSSIAHTLDESGHSVAVIDQDPESFRKLGPTFTGRTVVGVGFDRDTLREAGIDKADAFVAVSSGDNSNIVSARVARENYGIDRVVARIYDPRRAEIYQRLGIPTVATVRWTADQMLRRILPEAMHEEYRDPSGQILLAEFPVHGGWIGHRVSRLTAETGVRVAFLSRLGEGQLVGPDTVLQEGDVVHALTVVADAEATAAALRQEPEAH